MSGFRWLVLLAVVIVSVAGQVSANENEEINAVLSVATDLIEIGQDQRAEEFLESIDPKIVEGQQRAVLSYLLGVARMNQGQYIQALEDFDSATAGGFRPPSLEYRRGLSYLELEEYQKAVVSLQTYVENYPGNTVGYQLLGRAHALAGNTLPGRERPCPLPSSLIPVMTSR